MPFPPRARVYLWSMALAGLGALAFWAWAWHGPAPTNVGLVLFLAALAAFAQHFPLPIGPRHKVDASSAVYFAALLLFGMPVAVGLVGVSQLVGGATLALRRNPVSGKRMRTPRSIVFNAGQLMLATGLAGLVYYTILPQSAPAPLERLANLWALPLAAAMLYLVNTLAVSTMAGLQLGQRPLELWLAGQRVRALQSIAIFLAGLGTALISANYAWGPLALLVPAALVYLSLKRTVQLVEQAQRREREAALLAEAGRLFNASLELPATLGAVVDLTGSALGDSCDLFLLVNDQDELHPAACYHADADECARRRARYQADPPHRGEGHIGAVANGGPPALVRDARADPRVPRVGDEAFAPRSWVCVPLRTRGALLGVLTLGSGSATRPLDERDLTLVEAIAERAAAAIDHARLHEDRRRGELLQRTIAALAREVGGTLEPGDVARRLADALHRHFAYSIVGVFLVDRGRREAVLRGFFHSRHSLPDDGSLRLPFGHGIVGWVAERGEALMLPDVAADARYVALDPTMPVTTRSELAVPVLGDDGPLGVIDLESEQVERFTAADLYVLRAVAQQAAVALENALLHQRLAVSAADLRAVLESIEHGVIMTDHAGRIRFVNRRLGALLGLEVAAVAGRPLLEVAEALIARRTRDPDEFMAQLSWLYAHPDEVATDEVTLTRPAACTLQRYSGPLRAPATGAVVGRIEVYTDVTEARQLERAKDEFLATASHELKTPIMTAGGYLELLERQVERPEGPDPARLTRYAATARSELTRLTRLSEDLLDVARIEAGRLTLHPEPADLAAIVRETVERFVRRPGVQERGHQVVCHAGEPLPGRYDALRLGQVFANLLQNALKYSPDGGEVLVTVERAGEEAVVSVRDAGIGVPPEERERLFEPFYRAANASDGSPEGLGLGLYISRGIVEGHGGRVWIEAAPDGGSIFRVALPLGERSREAASAAGPEPRPASPPAAADATWGDVAPERGQPATPVS